MFMRMKYLGVALLAFAGLAAATAGFASAKIIHDFYSAKNPTIITGDALPGTSINYEFGEGWTLTCLTNKANGTIKETPTSQLTVEFTHSNCTLNEMAATVDSTTCKYVFSGETDETQHGRAELECGAGSKLRVTTSGCTLEIGPQSLGQSATYKSTELLSPRDVDVSITGKGIVYEKVGVLCALIGGNGKDLSINGVYTMKGYEDNNNKEGNQVNFWSEPTIFP